MFRYCNKLITPQISKQLSTQITKPDVQQIINSLDTQPYVVDGRNEWYLLTNKTINRNIVILKQMGDIHPTQHKPKFNCETLILDQCNKNFVYYWLDSGIFPDVQNIFLLSHPCEPNIFSRWYNVQKYYPNKIVPNIFLAHYYERYKNRWANEMENVIIINDNDIEFLKNKLNILELEPVF